MHNEIAAPIKSINYGRPPFPSVAILFSKQPGNSAYELVRFEDQNDVDQIRTRTVAAIRVLLHTNDLDDVPVEVLKLILNTSRPDFPVGAFPDTPENRDRVIALVKESATPYKEHYMADNENGTATAPANSTEAKAAERKQKADEEADKKARAEKRSQGVIGTIKSMLDTKTGASQNEVLDALVKKFPERTRDGMSSTVKIQFSRLAKSTGREIHNANIEGRGRVYKFKDQGEVPGKIVVPAAPAGSTEPATSPAAGQSTDGAVATTPAVATSATGTPTNQPVAGSAAAPKAAGGAAGGKKK
jgi:hypothetical protein